MKMSIQIIVIYSNNNNLLINDNPQTSRNPLQKAKITSLFITFNGTSYPITINDTTKRGVNLTPIVHNTTITQVTLSDFTISNAQVLLSKLRTQLSIGDSIPVDTGNIVYLQLKDNYNIENSYQISLSVTNTAPTVSSTIIIDSADDLQLLAIHPNAHFEFNADIDLAGKTFIPLPHFGGTIDGKQHTIRNLKSTFTGESRRLGGVIQKTSGNVSISNLAFFDMLVQTDFTSHRFNGNMIGGLIGNVRHDLTL